ncbi:HNH endonuclease [Ruminococcaceae bacterium OttesenSCG-928-N02]|nr:HNH endonuclease [Ruminococcaceae bacterium OttesenSCG-928-N02]
MMNNWQLSFKDWLKTNRNLSDRSLGHYAGAIKSILSWIEMDLSDITAFDEFQNFKNEALKNRTFIQRDTTGNNMYSVALRHFEEFVKSDIFRDSLTFPEVVQETELLEGEKKTVTINAYERNPNARKRCIQYHGDSCSVCGFRFADVFGDDFEGVIHVHHLKPLSEVSQEYIVDPIKDLAPVCPNCHLVIHSKPGGAYSIDEAKAMLRK